MYVHLAKFINKAQERIFNDSLMRLLIIEIQIKSGEINENMILPRYYNKGIFYEREYYKQSAMIKDLLPKKALVELKELVIEATYIHFENKNQIKNWIVSKTGINDCSLSVSI